MKWRIVKSGKYFNVQVRKFGLWFDIESGASGGGYSFIDNYETEEEAEKDFRKRFGTDPDRIRQYSIV